MKKSRWCMTGMVALVMTLAAGGTLQSCASSGWSMPNAQQLTTLGVTEQDVDAAALNRGRALAMTECFECHKQYWPQEYSARRWLRLAEDMGRRASLSPDQIDDLTYYMVTASKTADLTTP